MKKDTFIVLMVIEGFFALIAMGLLFSDMGAIIYLYAAVAFSGVLAPFAIRLKKETDEAKKLIRQKRSFSEIAERLCFDSLSHFNSVFKKYAGMTPGEYKDSIK